MLLKVIILKGIILPDDTWLFIHAIDMLLLTDKLNLKCYVF